MHPCWGPSITVSLFYAYFSPHHPDGGLVEHGDEGQNGPRAADDGEGLSREGSVDHAAHGRRGYHLVQQKKRESGDKNNMVSFWPGSKDDTGYLFSDVKPTQLKT